MKQPLFAGVALAILSMTGCAHRKPPTATLSVRARPLRCYAVGAKRLLKLRDNPPGINYPACFEGAYVPSEFDDHVALHRIVPARERDGTTDDVR
jgi:hypothetical protein